eukprot:gene12559-biopygen4192
MYLQSTTAGSSNSSSNSSTYNNLSNSSKSKPPLSGRWTLIRRPGGNTMTRELGRVRGSRPCPPLPIACSAESSRISAATEARECQLCKPANRKQSNDLTVLR